MQFIVPAFGDANFEKRTMSPREYAFDESLMHKWLVEVEEKHIVVQCNRSQVLYKDKSS